MSYLSEGNDNLKKGPWQPSEDLLLTNYVNRNGTSNWNSVARNSGLNRSGKSCRCRWKNQLQPDLKKNGLSPQEQRIVIELHYELGNKWAKIAKKLSGRTDNEIKNFWNTKMKKKNRENHQPSSQTLPNISLNPNPNQWQTYNSFAAYPLPPALQTSALQNLGLDTLMPMPPQLGVNPHMHPSSSYQTQAYNFDKDVTSLRHIMNIFK